MQDQEEVLVDSNRTWTEEQKRVEELHGNLPFGYDYILEMLDEIAINLTPQTLFNGGVMLGRLIQIIIENKDKE